MSAGIFAGRKGRARKETLTAYLFLLPSILIIFVFGLWPVVHAAYHTVFAHPQTEHTGKAN